MSESYRYIFYNLEGSKIKLNKRNVDKQYELIEEEKQRKDKGKIDLEATYILVGIFEHDMARSILIILLLICRLKISPQDNVSS